MRFPYLGGALLFVQKKYLHFSLLSLQCSLQVRDSLWCLKNITIISPLLGWSIRYKHFVSNKDD